MVEKLVTRNFGASAINRGFAKKTHNYRRIIVQNVEFLPVINLFTIIVI
ncbi:MAG: hypothetical protein PHH90_08810 [Limnochordia bacterium]|nr:hypothetical protein [Limnochordia bacterium]